MRLIISELANTVPGLILSGDRSDRACASWRGIGIPLPTPEGNVAAASMQ